VHIPKPMTTLLTKLPLFLLPAISFGVGDVLSRYSDAVVQVNGLTWKRTMDIETYIHKKTNTWCQEMPNNITMVLDVRLEMRSKSNVERRTLPDSQMYTYRQVVNHYAPEKRTAKDGKSYTREEFVSHYGEKGYKEWILAAKSEEDEWHQENIDFANDKWVRAPISGDCGKSKDGVEEETCYIEEVWDLRCEYIVEMWDFSRQLVSEGSDRNLKWPVSNVEPCATIVLDCERERHQKETFEAKLTVSSNNNHEPVTCGQNDMTLSLWQQLEDGNSYYAKKYTVSGLDCSSLEIRKYVDVSAIFPNNADKATIEGFGEVKCCCLEGKSTNICLLPQTVKDASVWQITDPNGCGQLVAQLHGALHTQQWHSHVKTPSRTCVVSKDDADKLNLQKHEL